MINIIEKDRCTGCGACVASCPKNAISTYYDSEGFEYPHIDQSLCIDCGLCQKRCPSLNFEYNLLSRVENNSVQRGFAARNKNYQERLASSSGGIFPVLAHAVLEDGGIVVGTSYDEFFNVEQSVIEKDYDLIKIQGSKYLQVKIKRDLFPKIKASLESGRKVLYSGLACQCEGLHSYLNKDYDNLFCVDLICMGVPSSVVWQKYLHAYFPNEKIKGVNFKEKSIGWDSFVLAISTDSREFKQLGRLNPYFRSMFKTYNMRKSCFICPFKKKERYADITLADCWGVASNTPAINDNKGLSSVLIHTYKGFQLWETINHKLDFVERPYDEFIKGNPNMVENRAMDLKNRNKFYLKINSSSPREAFEFAGKDESTFISRITKRIKTILSK